MAASSSSISERVSESAPGTVSAAVREHLRQLCLREFPCGTGSWVRAPEGAEGRARWMGKTQGPGWGSPATHTEPPGAYWSRRTG
jgi:hypothetical protein